MIEQAGLTETEMSSERWDTFSGAPQAGSAANFGTHGIAIRARKPPHR
jgi:hypothetical protein